jgi:hypothetical protein
MYSSQSSSRKKSINHLFISEKNQWSGLSSFFFIFSAIKSWNCCHNTSAQCVSWKFFNSTLVVASYMCNTHNYKEPYLLIDYLNIHSIALVFLSFSFDPREWIHPNIVPFFLLFSACEYAKYKTINITKNMSVVFSIAKLVLYLVNGRTESIENIPSLHSGISRIISDESLKLLILSVFFGKVSYFLRFLLLQYKQPSIFQNNFSDYHVIILTSVFHLCIVNILYVSSTAISRSGNILFSHLENGRTFEER